MELKHNEKIREYIDNVCSQVRFRDVHGDVSKELEAHIYEIAEEYIVQGVSENEAVEKAIVQMGDADIIGKQLNKIHKPKPEWSILLFSFLFTSIGLLAMYIIQRHDLMLSYSNPMLIFEKSLAFAITSLALIVCLYFFDYRKLEKYSMYIYLGTLLILIFTVFQGYEMLGNNSWIRIGPFTINFVAVSPLLFSIALAGIFNKWDWNSRIKQLQGFALLAAPLFFISIAPSMSVGITYIIACIVLLVISGTPYKQIGLSVAPLLIAPIFLIISDPFRLARFLAFLNPGADPMGMGYMNIQLRNALANSGFFGHGFTLNSQVTHVTLPALHTDFIFTFITYSFGWVTSILLIGLIAAFLIRIARIARQVKITYAKLLLSSFVAIFAVQFVWNIAMNLGLAPMSEISLPFISYSGSQLVINAAMIGIISSIYRRRSVSQSYSS